MPTVKADYSRPTHDIKLSDGETTIGLMLAGGKGTNDPLAITRNPYPRTSTKIATGESKYEDYELPYRSVVQDDWTGGRGANIFEDDTTRYADSYRAWTDQINQIILGGQETYTSGIRNLTDTGSNGFNPGSMQWKSLISGSDTYIAHKVIPLSTYHFGGYMLWLRHVGDCENNNIMLEIEIWGDSGGNPEESMAVPYSYVLLKAEDFEPLVSRQYYLEKGYKNTVHLDSGTTYWLVIKQTGNSDEDNHWDLGVNAETEGTTYTKTKTDAGSWADYGYQLYYRVLDEANYNIKFFEYKRCLYAVCMNQSRQLYIYRNGYRGVADLNIANKGYLNDTDATWDDDEFNDHVVLITKGPGSQEKQPWRTIVDTDATNKRLSVDYDWEIAQTEATEYVILGANTWEAIDLSLTTTITDVAVANEFVYLAQMNDKVIRYNERNVAGVWTSTSEEEPQAMADKLLSISTPEGYKLWGGVSNDERHHTSVWVANVPDNYSTNAYLYTRLNKILDLNTEWDEQTVTYADRYTEVDSGDVKVTLESTFSTGLIATKAIAATDFSAAKRLGFFIYSDRACSEDDLRIIYDDTPECLKYYLPDDVIMYDTNISPASMYKWRADIRPANVWYYDDGAASPLEAWNRMYNGLDLAGNGTFKITMAATVDFIYVSCRHRAKSIYMSIASGNTNASTLSAEIWDGKQWSAITITDNTRDAGLTKCLSQTGWIDLDTSRTDWNPGCPQAHSTIKYESYLPTDQWHIRFKVSALTTEITITDINTFLWRSGEFPTSEQFIPMHNPGEDKSTANVLYGPLYDGGAIYVAHTARFDKVRVLMGDVANSYGGSLLVYFFNGTEYESVADLVDGTSNGGSPLGYTYSSGWKEITFTMPDRWQKGCLPYEDEYLSQNYFILKIVLDLGSSRSTPTNMEIRKITIEGESNDLFKFQALTNIKDGDSSTYNDICLDDSGWLYVIHGTKFNLLDWLITTGNGNSVADEIYAQYFIGISWEDLGILTDTTTSGGCTLAQSGQMTFTMPDDWAQVTIENNTGYAIRIRPAAVDLSCVRVKELRVGMNNKVSISIGALEADTWHYQELTISDNDDIDLKKIVSIGIYRAVNPSPGNSQTIRLHDAIYLLDDVPVYIPVGASEENIVSLEAYGDERENPWVITDGNVWEIQTQNNNAPVAIPLREIRSLRSEVNGRAHTVSNIYLMFNLGQHFEKYYQHALDDIGPDRDAGLPAGRSGTPVCALSYPGRVFLAIDAGEDGYSSVLEQKSSGWHEIYRTPNNQRIYDMKFQVIPGMIDRLWVSFGAEAIWLPLPDSSFNPLKDSNFRYTHEAFVITGWYTLGLLDIEKFFKSIKLYTAQLLADNQWIEVDYQMETGSLEGGWTSIDGAYTISPFEEKVLISSYDTRARRIRFRYRLYTIDNTTTPVLMASILEVMMKYPVKYAYNISYRIEDNPEDYTGEKDRTIRAEDIAAIIDYWSSRPIVLTMNCLYSPFDNKLVVIDPTVMKPIELDATDKLTEKHYSQMTLMEA